MGIITTPVTGAAVTGLTTPGYVLSNDTSPPGTNGIAYIVSALTGTQTGVRTHSVSSQFSVLVYRPATPRLLAAPNPSTGRIANIPSNTYGFVVRKGVLVYVDQPYSSAFFRGAFSIPAGAETYDSVNVAALFSFAGGAAFSNATALYNLALTGAMTQ